MKQLLLLLCIFTGICQFYAKGGQPLENISTSTEFERAIEKEGGIINDLSDSSDLHFEEPLYGYVNLSGFEKMPETKTSDLQGWLEFFDGTGNYFKKRVIINAQGKSSMAYVKKNISIDFCDDEWIGKKTPSIAFGDWVSLDSFHLKAYYTDYFRGLAVVAYRFFDSIIADRGNMAHPWQRAGVETADAKARCHPDGFPVGVYLNGDFYGVFSWQLKKHRKNLGLTKDCAEHINLDGTLSWRFFNGEVDWTLFEIRNPKTLYCQDGTKYDGDNPKEIMDSTSPYFDPENKNHILSDKVKQNILRLITYVPTLHELRNKGYSSDEIRARFADMFDVQGLIDYTVFSSVVNNVDGWEKNWQWITYDGVKWFVEPYDLDMTFGNMWNGFSTTPPEFQNFYEQPYQRFGYIVGPAQFINTYFAKDLDERYARLRDSGVIDSAAIIAMVREWYNRIGEDNYLLEYSKWTDSYCNRDLIIDPNWLLGEDITLYLSLSDWDPSVTYQPGDMCRAYNRVWIANNEVKGINPCPQPGYKDSLDRVEDWIIRRVAMEDSLWNYEKTQSGITVIPETTETGESTIESIYDLTGRRLTTPQPGINIVRHKNGNVSKIIIK